jgi:exosome complex RNA-binding protein Rrp42 (RNase PH superfamily)
MGCREFEFDFIEDNTSMIVGVDSDGSVEYARKWDRGLCTDIDVTEYIKNSIYWHEKIVERIDQILKALKENDDWKTGEDR